MLGLALGGLVPENGKEVEFKGVLESLSKRFYTGGWGYGVLRTEKGQVKITGALEGHVPGTSVRVRGAFAESKYGTQLQCTAIVVDSVSGDLPVVAAWATKYCKDYFVEIHRACRNLEPEDRWEFIQDKERLLLSGFTEEAAQFVSEEAKNYFAMIQTKLELMEMGLTDKEAELLVQSYGLDAKSIMEDDPYLVVLDRVLVFTRVDAVVGERYTRLHPRRLDAALVQAIASELNNGHTAVYPEGAIKGAAALAGVFPIAIEGWITKGLTNRIVMTGELMQLSDVARIERNIARWVGKALRRG